MKPSLGLAALAVLLVGCDSSNPAPATPDAAPIALDCHSPFALPDDPGAQVRAQLALSTLAPAATLTWSTTRRTLSRIDDLNHVLTGCSDATNVYDPLFALLASASSLFQINRADWSPDAAVPCSSVTTDGITTVVLRRVKYGPFELRNDVFSAVLVRENGQVVVRSVAGTYLPPPSPLVLAPLQGCPDLPDAQLEPLLRTPPFAYANFDPPPAPPCSLGAPGSYMASAADRLTIADGGSVAWSQDNDDSPVTLRRVRSATLLVAPAGVTPDLERSDANCPDDANQPRVGWIRSFDAVTGELLGDKVNPIEGCIVC
jgi:hypothetical protein